jgi:hypothetical protein
LDESSSRFDFLIEHDFFRKAANTFPDHALAPFNRRLACRLTPLPMQWPCLSLTNAGHVVATRRRRLHHARGASAKVLIVATLNLRLRPASGSILTFASLLGGHHLRMLESKDH